MDHSKTIDLSKYELFIFNDFIVEKRGSNYYGKEAHILFLKACIEFFKSAKICARQHVEEQFSCHQVSDSKTTVIPLPFYSNVVKILFISPLKMYRLLRTLANEVKKSDIIWLTWSHPLSMLILLFFITKQQTVILTVRSDAKETVKVKYRNLTRLFSLLFISLSNIYLRFCHKQVLIFTTGEELLTKYSKGFSNSHLIKHPIVSMDDFKPKSRKIDSIINLLFIGRLEAEKGIHHLINSVAFLKESRKVNLKIIGEGVLKNDLMDQVVQLGLDQQIKFYGFVPFGEELFEFYEGADILVIPSITEGVPKIINEARAFSLPIVTTNVGGIKTELVHLENCIMINPGSAEEICDGVIKLADTPALYSRISKSLARQFSNNNLEYWSYYFATKVADYVRSRRWNRVQNRP